MTRFSWLVEVGETALLSAKTPSNVRFEALFIVNVAAVALEFVMKPLPASVFSVCGLPFRS